jgi:hypothetical protein
MSDDKYPSGQLATIQDDLRKQAADSANLGDVPILTEQMQDIENEILRAIGPLTEQNAKSGVCIIVLTPRARASKPNLPGPYFDNVRIVGRVVENVTVNQSGTGTKKPASQVAEYLANAWHRKILSNGKVLVVTEISIVPDESNLIYDVLATTEFGL